MMFDPVPPFVSSAFSVKFATEAWERRGAAALRRQVFCVEQGLFGEDDRDALDEVAIPIVALSSYTVAADAVVGTVRIHEAERGIWWGSRLAVAADHRRVGALGASLIRLAVSSAHWCTFGLAGAKRSSGVASANPSPCRDGLRRLPLDGPHETSRTAGAGRPGRTTG